MRGQPGLPAIGQWREHLPYNSAIDLAAGEDRIFCATPYSLFSVMLSGNTISRMSRVTGLSETGISALGLDPATGKLLIAYTNSNIDVLYRNDLYNIPGIKRATLSGDKTIYSICPLNGLFYLSAGIGVIVIDAAKYEVKDTWQIGNGGNAVKVNGFVSDGTYYYAATEEGLKRAAVSSLNPADHRNWELLSGFNGLPAGACRDIQRVQNRIIARKRDSLFVQQGTSWSLFYAGGWPVISLHSSENKLLVCERNAGGSGRVSILNPDATLSGTLSNVAAVSYPRKAILKNTVPWLADQFAGLSRFTGLQSYQTYSLNGPQALTGGDLISYNNKVYATAGSVNEAWNYQYNGDGFFIYSEGEWNNINRYRYPVLDSLLDFMTITADPRDESVWAGSYGGGLLQVKPGPVFEIFKQGRLEPAVGDPGSYRVAGLAFDRNQHLWIANFGAAQPLRVRKADGSWNSFSIPFPLFQNALSQLLVDESNYLWMVSPLGNGLICYDPGASVDNRSDDKWKRLGTGTGNGHLPDNDVRCIARDKDGFIWVGTANGIGVLQCPATVFSTTGCDAVWPVLPSGNFAGYLFRGQEVRSIAVDGANRKWVATKNGVFLLNASGEKMLLHFNENNSPLLSDDVRKIAIDGKTGEVFMATAKGTCSYRGTATEGTEKNENLQVFPNPVPAGYSGTIAIRGLSNNAIVKITELDGRLVYQTRALGGQATWDGRNYRGQKISSGAYLVMVSGDERSILPGKKEQASTKLFFISN